MTTATLLEIFAGFLAAGMALWMAKLSLPSASSGQPQLVLPQLGLPNLPGTIKVALRTYLQRPGLFGSIGLLLLRVSVGVMMVHHGHEKLADPQQFADTYVASLHLPFPLFFAYAAGFSELIGSWLVILGFLTPLGALALTGTMAVAAYQHILTAGLNIYVLELVVLYLGGSLGILFNGPGLFSVDWAMGAELLTSDESTSANKGWSEESFNNSLTPAAIPVQTYD